jgi:hypothetical protein
VFNLFAILKTDQVVRMPLDGKAQEKLSELFDSVLSTYLSTDRERCEYEPGFKPEEDELVEVAFTLPEQLARLSPVVPPDVKSHEEGAELKALVIVDTQNSTYCFQSLTRGHFIGKRKMVLFFSPGANQVSDEPGLMLGTRLDAAHQGGKLYFTSEAMVRRFLDLDVLFAEATNPEIVSFFSSDSFTGFDQSAVLAMSDNWVRRKVTMLRKANIVGTTTTDNLLKAAKNCEISLKTADGRLTVPASKVELKTLIRFLSEDFLESPIRKDLFYEVNSKRQKR